MYAPVVCPPAGFPGDSAGRHRSVRPLESPADRTQWGPTHRPDGHSRLVGALAAVAALALAAVRRRTAARRSLPRPSTSPWATPMPPAQAAGRTSRRRPASRLSACRPRRPIRSSALAALNLGCAGAKTIDVAAVAERYAQRAAGATVVTVTVGGNDIDTVQGPPSPAPSRPDHATLRGGPVQLLGGQASRTAGQDQGHAGHIVKKKAPHARIVLTGYPRLFTVGAALAGRANPGRRDDEFVGRPAQRDDRLLGPGEQGQVCECHGALQRPRNWFRRALGSWRRASRQPAGLAARARTTLSIPTQPAIPRATPRRCRRGGTDPRSGAPNAAGRAGIPARSGPSAIRVPGWRRPRCPAGRRRRSGCGCAARRPAWPRAVRWPPGTGG